MKAWWINVQIGYHVACGNGAHPMVAAVAAAYLATFGLPGL